MIIFQFLYLYMILFTTQNNKFLIIVVRGTGTTVVQASVCIHVLLMQAFTVFLKFVNEEQKKNCILTNKIPIFL